MQKQHYSNKEKAIIYIRTTVEIAEWIRRIAFEEGKSVNYLINELFEYQKAESDRYNE